MKCIPPMIDMSEMYADGWWRLELREGAKLEMHLGSQSGTEELTREVYSSIKTVFRAIVCEGIGWHRRPGVNGLVKSVRKQTEWWHAVHHWRFIMKPWNPIPSSCNDLLGWGLACPSDRMIDVYLFSESRVYCCTDSGKKNYLNHADISRIGLSNGRIRLNVFFLD